MSATDRMEQRDLWRSVILQAVSDAMSAAKSKEVQRERHLARQWFCDGGPDFREVCAMAELDPAHVRRTMIERLDEMANEPPKVRTVRRDYRQITFNGQTMTIPDWARHIGMTPASLYQRLDRGMSIEAALTKAPRASYWAKRNDAPARPSRPRGRPRIVPPEPGASSELSSTTQ